MSKCRRVAGLALCLVVVTMAVLGGWSSRPPVNAAATVDLPAGFLDAPENVEFLRSLTIPQDKLELILSMRDTAEEGQPPFWAEVQALMIVEQERKQWEWALTETGAEHTFRDAVKQMKPILDLYLFLSKASVGWAYGSSSLPGIIGDYLRVKKWVSTWKAVVNAGKVIENFKNLPARSRNEFIWWSAQEDVEVFPDNRYTLSLLAPEMDSEEGMALAHHIYIVLQEDIEADKQELADKLFDLARQSGVTITGLRQFQADGTTSIAVGGAVTGGEMVVSATVGSPSAPVRLEVVTRPPGTLSAGSRNYESPYGAGGKTTLTISLDDYLPGEYVWLARACDQNGGASVWTSFGDNLPWNADFVLGAATGTLTVPTLKSVKPKADGASPGIVLEWTPVAGADNYEIYRDNLLLHTTRPPGTTFWNTGLTPGQSYSYRVRARSGYQFGPLSAGVSAVAPPPDLSATQPRVVVDSNPVPLDVTPTNVSGSLLVPIRAISEALGAQVGWDQVSQTVTLTLGGDRGEARPRLQAGDRERQDGHPDGGRGQRQRPHPGPAALRRRVLRRRGRLEAGNPDGRHHRAEGGGLRGGESRPSASGGGRGLQRSDCGRRHGLGLGEKPLRPARRRDHDPPLDPGPGAGDYGRGRHCCGGRAHDSPPPRRDGLGLGEQRLGRAR